MIRAAAYSRFTSLTLVLTLIGSLSSLIEADSIPENAGEGYHSVEEVFESVKTIIESLAHAPDPHGGSPDESPALRMAPRASWIGTPNDVNGKTPPSSRLYGTSLSHQVVGLSPAVEALHEAYKHFAVRSPQLRHPRRVIISSGEHAREWIPVEAALDLIDTLTTPHKHSPSDPLTAEGLWAAWVLQRVSVDIIPLVNPSGRAAMEEGLRDACWRRTADGVDVNRNGDWEWGNPAYSSSSEEYGGTAAWSAPEAAFVRDVILGTVPGSSCTWHGSEDAGHSPAFGFVSLHSGIRALYAPYADDTSRNQGRKPTYHSLIGQILSWIQESLPGYFVEMGAANEVMAYSASGVLMDAAVGALNVVVAFAMEVWGDANDALPCFQAFNPEPSEVGAALDSLKPAVGTMMTALASTAVSVGDAQNIPYPKEAAPWALNQLAPNDPVLLKTYLEQVLNPAVSQLNKDLRTVSQLATKIVEEITERNTLLREAADIRGGDDVTDY